MLRHPLVIPSAVEGSPAYDWDPSTTLGMTDSKKEKKGTLRCP